MKFQRKPLSVCLALSSLFAVSAQAEQNPENNDTIIVTASRIDSDINKATAYTSVITAEQIANSPQKTLPEILATEAGIFSRSLYGNNAARATIDMRGFGAAAKQNTLILLDGRRLNDVDLAAIDFTAIPLKNIERIEIIRGGGSVLYGDGATGGTINIITKQAVAGDSSTEVAVSLGSFNNRSFNGIATTTIGSTAIGFAVSKQNADGYRDNNELDQLNLQADFRTELDSGELYFKLASDDQKLGLPGVRTVDPGSSINQLESDRSGTSTLNDFANQKGSSITAGHSMFVSDNTELILDGGYRRKNQTAFFDYGGGSSSYLDTDLNTWSITPRLSIEHDVNGQAATTIVGLDYYRSNYDSARAQTASSVGTPIHDLTITQNNIALYAQHERQISDKFNADAGIRLQKVEQKASDTFNSSAPGGSAFDSEAPNLNESDSEQMLSLGARYSVSGQLSVFSHLERSVRFATVDEIFSTFPGAYTYLKPQTANQFNLGADYQRGKISSSANIYIMDLDNEIHYDVATFKNVNLDPTRRQGLELMLKNQLTNDILLGINYAYTQAEFRGGSYNGNSIPVVPKTTANITVLWNVTPDVSFNANVSYVGERYFDNDQSNSFEKMPSYIVADMKLSNQYDAWTFSGNVYNVFDEEYLDYGVRSTATAGKYNAYPNPERSFSIEISRSF